MVKGGMLKDNTPLASLNASQGQTFMLIGTAGPLPQAPIKALTFVEDMTDSQLAMATRQKAGLTNLGNTCYLNSTLQVLRAVPELQVALGRFTGGLGGQDGEASLTASLRELYKSMNQTTEPFPPFAFLSILRQIAPQFAEMARPSGAGAMAGMGGGYAQQDAEEVWVRIINALQNALPGLPPRASASASSSSAATTDNRTFVQQFMTGEMSIKRSTKEAPEEPATHSRENFSILQCNISGTTNEMTSGISDSLTQNLEKRSETLGREAVYDEERRISRLPAYLACHFVRFYWRRDINKKTKIMRKVKFPFDLDTEPFMEESLKQKTRKTAEKIKSVEKARDERSKIRRRAKAKKEEKEAEAKVVEGGAAEKEAAASASEKDKKDADTAMAVDGDADDKKDGAEVGQVQLGQLLTPQEELELRRKEVAEIDATIDAELRADTGANVSGLYELVGIVTHKGAAADAGHYLSWVKKDVADANYALEDAAAQDPEAKEKKALAELDTPPSDEWYKFDDEKVTTVTKDKITMLEGGGEDSVAYIREWAFRLAGGSRRLISAPGSCFQCFTAAKRLSDREDPWM